jgi:dCTP deaminase
MVLSDVDIKRYIAEGKIKITPELPPDQFGSCPVDFRLGNEFAHSRHPYIDLRENKGIEGIMHSVVVPAGESFILHPREFGLAITEERLELCSFTFEQLSSPSSIPYSKKASNKYAGQTHPLASRLAGEFKG